MAGRRDAVGEIQRRPSLLVHYSDLYGVLREVQETFHGGENLDHEGHLGTAVHLWFHDIDASSCAVAKGAELT